MIGFWEVVFLIVLIVLILVVPSRLPEIMRDLGKAIKEFKAAMRETEEATTEVKKSLSNISLKEEEE